MDGFEAAVRRRRRAVVDGGLDLLRGERGGELDTGSSDDAVRRPGVDVVGFFGEVRSRVVMRVAGRDDVVVVAVGEQRADRGGDRRTSPDGQRTALAEVVLYVDHNQRTAHGATSS